MDVAGKNVFRDLGALCASAFTKFVILYALHKRKPRDTVKAGNISTIYIYPVKSCAGVDVHAARVTFSGLEDVDTGMMDRHFMVIDDDGNFITQRKEPKMALIKPTVPSGRLLHLTAPDMEELIVPLVPTVIGNSDIIKCRVWKDYIDGVHCGEVASCWLRRYLGKSAHLVYAAPDLQKRQLYYIDEVQRCRPHDKVAFQDWGQILVISDASVNELNARLQTAVRMANFRPNVTVSGCPAHNEDSWHKLYCGNVQLTNIKLCSRCVMTTIDPDIGEKDPDRQPLETLKEYRLKPGFGPDPCFGINVFCDIEGIIRIGDQVEVTVKQD